MASGDGDGEIRSNLIKMNQMFDTIMADAGIQPPKVPEVDLETTEDWEAAGEMLLGKLSAIEKVCDSASLTQKKYDARAIRDKIAMKRKQLAELEAENKALVETAQRQERALKQLGQSDGAEAQANVARLRAQLHAAQKEVKALEERRHGLVGENKRLRDDLAAVEHVEDEGQRAALEQRAADLEARKGRESAAFQKKMAQLREQREELLRRKAELEQRLKEKQQELKVIHQAKGRPVRPLGKK